MSQASGDVWSPVITPFGADLAPDRQRFVSHCQWLTSNGVGLAVFGTNSEANSMTVGEKQALLHALVDGGIDPARLMPGTGNCAIDDGVSLTRTAVEAGCAGVLMLPPFYYKGVSDEGLFRFYSEVINRVADSRLRIYLYHIPPVTQVPLSLELIERLRNAFPGVIAGIKDSGGDWAHTQVLSERFAGQDFAVYAGSERFLLDTLRAGGAGCISATANVNPAAIVALARHWQESDADERQQRLNVVRDLFEQYPLIPAMKAATAYFSGIDDWQRLRPPLVELDNQRTAELVSSLKATGFEMQGVGEARHG
ncbi:MULTISPECIES: dihydrodipicolinate synthase family protein [unclassified Halomonas]|uniref:dihydrodipicolinate synthase family protein n=1 Tax=unclassified Halomonas TaxID=2609666 RepID=UPI0006DAFF27|nr:MULTISPECIES: dihydrodipicolinate synthase family protein [unclassified Halomonas]KPQ27955.1 MAG: Dihydrodipicolinate synthase/N-acetylneuraminate lyase [Halomonas sp. HL-93]SBR51719.1 4-hydroxy-tetrahydrodipicolinate synthase [Halomonas sp. HL-93]SNY97483.1 4-hydroxy-tetrahydrodipicolinate synthase [Halomonas sp. hl-4]